MPSILHQAMVLEHYGARLTVERLAEALEMAVGTIRNQIAKKTFPIRTYTDGGRRYADYREVANYLDTMRETAA